MMCLSIVKMFDANLICFILDVDKILKTAPIMEYNNIPIKLKRKTRSKDPKQFTINIHSKTKIDENRLKLYVSVLLQTPDWTIYDMTPLDSDEQMHLIKSESVISSFKIIWHYTVNLLFVYFI